MSVISILGSTDSGINRLTAGIDSWREKGGCPAGPAAWADARQTVSKSTSICANGSEVVNYVIKGMGHSWPGGAAVGLGDPKTTVNAVDLMWEFFEAHPRRT